MHCKSCNSLNAENLKYEKGELEMDGHNGALRMLMLRVARVWTCTTAGGRTSGGRWRPGW